jgi:hypothetical protein
VSTLKTNILFLIFFGCYTPSTPILYADAIGEIGNTSRSVESICEPIPELSSKEDCFLWGARDFVQNGDFQSAKNICLKLSPEMAKECYFYMAEYTHESEYCALTADFEMDCRLHHLSHALLEPTSEHDWVTLIESSGLSPQSETPWVVIYRNHLSHPPLDLSKCDPVPNQTNCIKAGLGLMRDHLRMMRDTQTLSCNLSDWPPQFKFENHPLFQPIVEEFLSDISCSG